MMVRAHGDSYYGQRVRGLNAGGLLLSERAYPPRLELPPHAHERPYLCAVLQGGYTERCGGKEWSCAPQTVFLRPQGEVHTDRFSDAGGRVFGIEFGAEWPARIGALGSVLSRPAALTGVCAALALRLYREFRTNDLASPLAVEGLVLELLAEACRFEAQYAGAGMPRWLARVRDILHERFRAPPALAEMAREVGVHPVHLARVFRRRFACTVGEYVRRLRIQFACRELALTGCSLVDIALAAGFCDQSQFCRAFRQQLGMTASQFRRQMRGRQ
jgi:AraC family transcriptional regulator